MSADDEKYVLDTHPLIWYLAGDKKLSLRAREIIKKIERGEAKGYISVIVLAEMIFSFQKRSISLPIKQVIDELQENNFSIVALDTPQIISLQTIREIPEMHDRIVVVLALQRGAKLVTKDKKIRDAQLVEVVW